MPFATQALTVPDGSITKAKLASDVKFSPADGSITTAKLANGAVTKQKLSDNSLVRSSSATDVRIEYGSQARNATCDRIHIIFSQPFSQTPRVFITQREAATGYANYVTHVGVEDRVQGRKVGPSSCANTGWVEWMAIGK